MKVLSGALISAGLTLLAVRAVPPRAAEEPEGDAPGRTAEETDLDVFLRHAMPGPEHRLLDRLAGSWRVTTRYWMKPGMLPAEAQGTSERKWILGRRFVQEELEGGDLALPFRGLALYGYDAFRREYTSVWVDTMSTAMLQSRGKYEKSKDLVQFRSEYSDPWTGTKKKCRGITRFLDKGRHAIELYVTEPNGDEFKMLELTYVRGPG